MANPELEDGYITSGVPEWRISALQRRAHQNALSHGFWVEEQANPAVKIALLHSELSELLEAYRKGPNKRSTHEGLDLNAAAEECADVLIRLLDFCGGFGIDLENAVTLKMQYNEARPYRHEKKF